MAECRGLAPLSRRIDLLSTQSRFACPVDIPKLMKRRTGLRKGGHDCSRQPMCPRPDLHRHFAHFKYAVSALDYVGEIGAGIWSVQTGDRNHQPAYRLAGPCALDTG